MSDIKIRYTKHNTQNYKWDADEAILDHVLNYDNERRPIEHQIKELTKILAFIADTQQIDLSPILDDFKSIIGPKFD